MPGKNSNRRTPEPVRVWNLESIQELLDVLASKEIAEFEMEQQGVKIRVRRGAAQTSNPGPANGYVIAPGIAQTVSTPPPVPIAPVAAPAASGDAESGTAVADSTEGLFVMKSPIVGTFYASPSPNRCAVRQGGRYCAGGSGGLHHRGHEVDERTGSRRSRQGRARLRGERPAGGVRAVAVCHRACAKEVAAQVDSR